MFYETPTRGRRLIKTPLMEQVRREARLIGIERNIRIDELRALIERHAGDRARFRMVSECRRELINLYEQY